MSSSQTETPFFAAAIIFCLLSGSGNASDVPFVSGFDRFARHQEISAPIAGRLLLSELSCTACHTSTDQLLEPKKGPRLDAAGSRLNADWLKRFLTAPHQVSPGTTMPDVLAGVPTEHKPAVIDALTAFLSSQVQSFPEIKATGLHPVPFEFWKKGDVSVGRTLFHQIGCVACHEADETYEVAEVKPSPIDQMLEQLDPEEIQELGLAAAARRVESVPHGNLAAKYSPRSLTFFLLNPESVRPAGRMPDFQLGAMDAGHLAAYLLSRTADSTGDETELNAAAQSDHPADDTLIAEGRQLFIRHGCASCHSIRGISAQAVDRPLSQLTSAFAASCVSPQRDKTGGKPGQPHYHLDEVQLQAVDAALADVTQPASAAAEDPLLERLLRLNCHACHERDRRGGIGRFRKPFFETVGHVDIGDEGRLPPPLTGVGKKLQTGWLNNVLSGKGRVRSHMYVRMPQFPAAQVKPVPALLTAADQSGPRRTEQQVFDVANLSSLTEPGRLLMDAGCVQCHSFKGQSLPGTVGLDLQGVAQRLHPDWFYDFLLNPGALKERTRMPTFFPNGKSQNPDILHGDTDQQIAAMWAYLRDLDRQPLPEKIIQARARDYELKPVDTPIVLRTFMARAGTHAIAVGFPAGVHFAFDAQNLSLAEAWRGAFLDAEGTWFVRFAPVADPLGEDVIALPPGLLIANLPSGTSPWPGDAESAGGRFLGYRLDASGTPTFLYQVGSFRIEDRMTPSGDQQLERVLLISGSGSDPGTGPNTVWLRPIVGKQLQRRSPGSWSSETGLTVSLADETDNVGQQRNSNGLQEWVLPVTVGAQKIIKVTYSW